MPISQPDSPQSSDFLDLSHPDRKQTRALLLVFILLFLQLQLIVLASLCSPKGISLVREHSFGLDLQDFISAASDWVGGLSPYSRSRFVTPPPTLLVGMAFRRVPPQVASFAFFCVNLVAVFGSSWMIGTYFKMKRTSLYLMLGIASLYYPAIFLFERGNLDGLMLILICSAVAVKDDRLRAPLVACSVVLKVYSLLLLLVMLAAKRFRLMLLTLGLAVAIMVPFHSLVSPYLTAALGRSAQFTAVENLSPAVLLGSFCKHQAGKLAFGILWLGSLLAALWRHRNLPLEERLIVCFPWMAAFPLQVYPYTGVLLLPVLAWRLGSARVSANKTERGLFLAGFVLVGTQQGALNEYFQWLVVSHRFFPLLNVIGMSCILFSLAIGGTPAAERALSPPSLSEDRQGLVVRALAESQKAAM